MDYKLCFLIVVSSFISSTYARMDGAPLEACIDMTPQHGVQPQEGDAPYIITLNRRTTYSGLTVEVTVKGKTDEDKIRGFLMQARDGDEIIGKFEVSKLDNFMKTVDCTPDAANALTHKQHLESEDRNSFKAIWRAPSRFRGSVTFFTTIARNGGVFWVAVPSDPLKIY